MSRFVPPGIWSSVGYSLDVTFAERAATASSRALRAILHPIREYLRLRRIEAAARALVRVPGNHPYGEHRWCDYGAMSEALGDDSALAHYRHHEDAFNASAEEAHGADALTSDSKPAEE